MSNPGLPLVGVPPQEGSQVTVLQGTQPTTAEGQTQMGPQFPTQQPRKFQGTGVVGLATAIIGQVQARKRRELDQSMTMFIAHSKGVQEAQGQMDEAQKMIQNAMQRLQANPKDPTARDQLQAAAKQRQNAQQAIQSAQTNLRDMFNGPKGQKHYKMIEKAMGIDEKSQASPERQALIQAIRKQQQVDEQTAKLLSYLPQRQQLAPEAAGRALLQQAGVVGKPATGGQQLQSRDRAADRAVKVEKILTDAGLKTEDVIRNMRNTEGRVPLQDEKGAILRNPDGTMKTRNLEPSEMSPLEYQKYQNIRAQVEQRTAAAKSSMIRANAYKLMQERKAREAKAAQAPGSIEQWARLVSDPTSGVTLGTVPAAARGAVVQFAAANGMKIAKPLTGDEIKRIDLANNAVDNIEAAQAILGKRPDMFGPAGWGGTKFEMLFSGGDPDAVDFLTNIRLANLPAVGIHGVRGKWALEDLDKLDGNLYLNPESMTNVLNDIHRSASEFKKMAGRPASTAGGSGGGAHPPVAPQGMTLEQIEKTHTWREGARGWGWYKK